MVWADFLGGGINLAADGIIGNELAFDVVGVATLSHNANLVGISGSGRVTTGTTIGNGGFIGTNGGLTTQRSLNPVFEARVIVNTAASRAIAGFSTRATGVALTVDTNNFTDEVFFRKNAAGTNWEAVTRAASGAETITTLATACTGSTACTVNTMRILRIELEDIATPVARFYIDGTLVATHTTGIPLAATKLGHDVGITTTAAAAATTDVDYYRAWSDDPAGSVPLTTSLDTTVSDYAAEINAESKLPAFISASKQSLLDYQFVLTNMGTTSADALANATALNDTDSLTVQKYGEYFVQLVKTALEKMSDILINMTLWVKELKTDKIKTQELCIDDVCVTKEQLQQMIRASQQNQQPTPSSYEVVSVPVANTQNNTETNTELGNTSSSQTQGNTSPSSNTEQETTPTTEASAGPITTAAE